jgi:hypothetical protein
LQLAVESQQVFVVAIFAFHPGKTVLDIAAVEIAITKLVRCVYRKKTPSVFTLLPPTISETVSPTASDS